jgi:hypothetical protein
VSFFNPGFGGWDGEGRERGKKGSDVDGGRGERDSSERGGWWVVGEKERRAVNGWEEMNTC